MRFHGLARMAAAIGVAVALCVAGFVAVPARSALAAAVDPVNPGGDFTVSMPFSGPSSSFMSTVASTTYPSSLGVPTGSPLSTLMTASASQDSGSGSGAAPPPTTCNCGTISVSTVTQTVTETMPAADVPVSNSPGGPRGPLASFASAAITNLVKLTSLGICLFYNGYRMGAQPVQPPPALSTSEALLCATWADTWANITAYSLNDLWSGAAPAGTEWAKIVTFGLTNVAAGWLSAKYLNPLFLQYLTGFGSVIQGLVQRLLSGVSPWLGPAPGAVNATATSGVTAGDFVADINAQATMPTINKVFAANGLPTVAAEGTVEDRSLGNQDECMDAYGAQQYSYDGEPAAINACNGTPAQDWIEWNYGRGYMLTNGGLCLDITGANWSGAGVPLELYECNGQWNQSWWQAWSAFGTPEIQNPYNGGCMDDPNWSTVAGTQLQDDWCRFTTAQRWLMPGNTTGTGTAPSVTNYGPVDSGLSGECMDAYGSSNGASPGQIVAINSCNGNLAQEWTGWSDGTLRAWNLCLDTSGAQVGALAELENCDGATSQAWTQQSNGSLKNGASGLCLEDPGATTTAGTQLKLDTCNTAADERWALPPAPPGGTPPPPPGNGSACDLYAYYGTPCAAAYSMDRALYAGYGGPLYQVKRASDGTTANIGLLATGGDVNASQQDSFCASTSCTVTEIYDQSPEGNNLTIEQGGGAAAAPDQGADATALKIKIGGNEAYGLDIEQGTGYRDDTTTGIATGSAPEGMYMVASGTHVNYGCCFDFGNVETDNHDHGAGTMDAVNLTTWCGNNNAFPCSGGPWVEADLENGQWTGSGPNTESASGSDFVTAMLSNNGQNTSSGQNSFELQGGNSESGGLTSFYNGVLPSGYSPMAKQGAIVLGTGGDNSNSDVGSFFEGVMTEGYPTDAADAAVQANIVAAGYSGSTNPAATATAASAAGQALVHSGYSSVFTVDSANGHLRESYLPAMGDAWSTHDLSATGGTMPGTPPVMPGTQPVAVYHCGYTSVYTVDAANGDLQETYLSAPANVGAAWVTQDLSANYQAPPTNTTPTAVVHSTGAGAGSAGCDGYTSVYTVNRNGDLEETYLPNQGFPGDAWHTQDLSGTGGFLPGTPRVLPGTAPVAITHCGYTSVYTVDGANDHLQETYLPAIGGGWSTQDLSGTGGSLPGTPPTTTTPTAVVHDAGAGAGSPGCDGYTSVFTVDRGSRDLRETYLPNQGFPGDAWHTQDLSGTGGSLPGTPPVAPGTAPVALVHMGYTSVYTVDQGSDQLEETYLPAIGGSWSKQSLSANYSVPETDQTPIVLLHPDASGVLDWASVFTVDEFNSHLRETYLPNAGFPGDAWSTHDLSSTAATMPDTPPVYQPQSSPASWSVAHTGYTSTYTVNASDGHLEETYLPAMGASWVSQDLTKNYSTPDPAAHSTPVALVHDGYTSVYTVDAATGDLRESYLPALGDNWANQDLSKATGGSPVSPGTSPTAVFHDGYVSVFTVDEFTGDLRETFLPAAGFPGDAWHTQVLSDSGGSLPGTPPVMAGTSPVAVLHDGYVSVYTVDQNGDLQETYLPWMGDRWSTQDLTANYKAPKTHVTPTAVFHDGYTSVYTVDWNGDLQETYLPWMGDGWSTQDLTANYNVPQAINVAPAALYHDGYTSVYYLTGPSDHLVEAYLPAISGAWGSQDLSANYSTPPSVQSPSPLVHYDTSGALTWASVYTTDSSSGDVDESFLPDAGFPGDSWHTQDLSTQSDGPPAAAPPGSVMYSASSTASGLGYARMIRLQYAGSEDGTLLATFEDSNNDGSITSYHIRKSTDNGATWSTQVTVPAEVDAYAPFLYEFPKKLGNAPAGTLMLLGTTFNSGATGIAIREWLSFDHGNSWSPDPDGVVQQAGGLGDGVYEPFVTLDSSGNLAMLFSDERQNGTYGQFIGEIISTDGGSTWSAKPDGSANFGPGEIKVIASPWKADRPGMATVAQLGNGGSYVMSYEMCGPHNCAVYTKTSADGDNWGSGSSDFGTQAETAEGIYLQESPVLTWVPNAGSTLGTLYLTAHNEVNSNGPIPEGQTIVLANADGGQGSWSWVPAPAIPAVGASANCHIDYSPDLVPTEDGGGLLYTAAAATGPNHCQEVTDTVPIAP